MRWIISLLLVLALSTAGLFYWKNTCNKTQNPIALCSEDAWLIVQTSNIFQLIQKITDSTSVYSAIPKLEPTISELSELYTCFGAEHDFGIISLSGELIAPEITVISSQQLVNLPEAWYTQQAGEYHIYSNREILEITHQTDLQIETLELTDGSVTSVSFSPFSIQSLIGGVLSNPIEKMFFEEFPKNGWITFEVSDDQIYSGTAVAKTNNSTQIGNNSNLFRYLPSKTNAAILFSKLEADYALVSCNYGWNDSSELFLLISPNADSLNSLDLVAQSYFDQNWISDATLQMIGNVQLLSKNETASKRFISDFNANNRLTETNTFKSLASNISDASFSIYYNQRQSIDGGLLTTSKESDSEITSLVFQTNSEFSSTKSYSFGISHHSEIREDLRKVWKLFLDKPAENGPWFFENHYSGESEILIQDKLHQLYLINKDGKILWKKQLDNTIVGDIVMVDAFDSGKNQMLFATQKRLILLDRNGNYVEGFPINLDDPIHVGPTAIRYDRESEIRFFVCAGKSLLNFNNEGQQPKGWKLPKTGVIQSPIEYLKVGSKDYLIALNSSDSVLFLDRSGVERKKPLGLKMNIVSCTLSVENTMESSYVFTQNKTGVAVKTFFDGHQETIGIEADSNSFLCHNPDFGNPYVKFHENTMTTFDIDGNVKLEYLFPKSIDWDIRWLDAKQNLFAVSSGNQVYIIEGSSGPIERMPIDGDLRCLLIDLDGNGISELVNHKSDGSITCYQLGF